MVGTSIADAEIAGQTSTDNILKVKRGKDVATIRRFPQIHSGGM